MEVDSVVFVVGFVPQDEGVAAARELPEVRPAGTAERRAVEHEHEARVGGLRLDQHALLRGRMEQPA